MRRTVAASLGRIKNTPSLDKLTLLTTERHHDHCEKGVVVVKKHTCRQTQVSAEIPAQGAVHGLIHFIFTNFHLRLANTNITKHVHAPQRQYSNGYYLIISSVLYYKYVNLLQIIITINIKNRSQQRLC